MPPACAPSSRCLPAFQAILEPPVESSTTLADRARLKRLPNPRSDRHRSEMRRVFCVEPSLGSRQPCPTTRTSGASGAAGTTPISASRILAVVQRPLRTIPESSDRVRRPAMADQPRVVDRLPARSLVPGRYNHRSRLSPTGGFATVRLASHMSREAVTQTANVGVADGKRHLDLQPGDVILGRTRGACRSSGLPRAYLNSDEPVMTRE